MSFDSRLRHGIGRRALLAGAGLLAAPTVLRAQGQTQGVALVIGNSKYKWEASLPNVRRDAPDMAKRFQALGLKTELLQDVGRDAMKQAVDKFQSAARGADLAAFYFAGHGASWANITYLVPEDADLSTPSVVPTLVSVPSVVAAMKEASHRLLILDSCRNNPADGWRQLAEVRAGVVERGEQGASGGAANTLVLYSTAPGRVALDGPAGENSPFAAALLRQLEAPSVDLQALGPKLRRDLLIATEGRQLVWDQNSYAQPFGFRGTGKASAAGGMASSVIELPNAYAFARESDLFLPAGLVALRPAGGSRDGQKIGAFKFTAKSMFGPHAGIIVVLSVEGRSVEAVIAQKNHLGTSWMSRTGPLSGDRFDVIARDQGPRLVFDWKDPNGGNYSQVPDAGGTENKYAATSSRMVRLDG